METPSKERGFVAVYFHALRHRVYDLSAREGKTLEYAYEVNNKQYSIDGIFRTGRTRGGGCSCQQLTDNLVSKEGDA